MAKTPKTKKARLAKESKTAIDSDQNRGEKTKAKSKKPTNEPQIESPPVERNADSDTEAHGGSDTEPTNLASLLEPYTKDQLVDIISSAAVKHPSLVSFINKHADQDVSHRKIFVHGFSWDTTYQDMLSVFQPFGEVEDCHIVLDKATGKAKGYGFVSFKTRKEAEQALIEPRKVVNNRIVSCQLASIGPIQVEKDHTLADRRIYVRNVPLSADKDKLKAFFSSFGEIEVGPMGFDKETSKSKGYALFVYKKVEAAKKVLEEPYKVFEGIQLHCSRAFDIKTRLNQVQGNQQLLLQQQIVQQPQVLAAIAAQNLALLGQNAALNPLYAGHLANAALPTAAGGINPSASAAASQGLLGTTQIGGLGVGGQPIVESLGTGQGLDKVYSSLQSGQAGLTKSPLGSSSFAGYRSLI